MTPVTTPKTETPLRVVDGTTLTIDVLRWNEGWDFDCPVVVLRPVVRFSPNGEEADQIVEDLCISASIDGFMRSEPIENGLIDRAYPLKSLKRRWGMARGGREFPVKGYAASRFRGGYVSDIIAKQSGHIALLLARLRGKYSHVKDYRDAIVAIEQASLLPPEKT